MLSNSEIISLIKTKQNGSWNYIKFKEPELYNKIKSINVGNSFSEKMYRYLHNDTLNDKCIVCGNKSKYINLTIGYSKYCNKKCYHKVHGQKIKEAALNGKYKWSGIKAKETFLRNGGSYKTRQDKQKKTLLERYGVTNAGQMSNHAEKIRANNFKRFGTEKNPKISLLTKQRIRSGEIGFGSKKYKEYLNRNNIQNVSQLQSIKEIKSLKNRQKFIEILFNGDRLKGLFKPLFQKDEYINGNIQYKFQCLVCNTICESHLNNGILPRCYSCNPIYINKGKSQKEVFEYIKQYCPDAVLNCRSILNGNKELDIYVPSKNIAIEYNGLYWHSEIHGKIDKHYHLNKTEECLSKGIRLIHIFDDEWASKKNIVKIRLLHILGFNSIHVGARECTIKEIDSSTKSKFLDEFHLQGDDKSKYKIGAYHNNELVAVMTFGGLRSALGSISKQNVYELYRFCTKHSIPGIASRLLQYFIKTYNPQQIITFADRRWSSGQVYINLGFSQSSITNPNYWYLEKYQRRVHRYAYRKHILKDKLSIFDDNLSEWKNMQLNGFDRIWDCGSIKYELTL